MGIHHKHLAHWHNRSGILPCYECDGTGGLPNNPHLRNGDPDCWVVTCRDCDGAGHQACEVCGFNIEVPGFDCLACDMARDIPAHLLTDEAAEALTDAIRASVSAAAKWEAEEAQARAAESYLPGRVA